MPSHRARRLLGAGPPAGRRLVRVALLAEGGVGHEKDQLVNLGFESGPLPYDHRDLDAQRRLVAGRCGGLRWEVPKLLAAGHLTAFDRYESRMRPFVTLNQALATENPGGPPSEESADRAKNAITL
ncbi:hypothetical protein AB0J42_05405 [Nonomuraea sp. NPDC049649]|uniref:hypothetical protein n=1 Tax=Nonomuraea sp. NPDC049649 TaxID=3155776 RepID=UPI0034289587